MNFKFLAFLGFWIILAGCGGALTAGSGGNGGPSGNSGGSDTDDDSNNAYITCGDGEIEGVEACDDGNTANGDGCSANCIIESGAGTGSSDSTPASKSAYWNSRTLNFTSDLDLPANAGIGVDSPIKSFPQNNTANATSRMGANVGAPSYYASQWMYLNLWKSAQYLTSRNASNQSDGRAIDYDENGWPRSLLAGQILTTYLSLDNGYHPSGRYVVTYDGEGTIVPRDGATLISSSPGRLVINYAIAGPQRFITLEINRISPAPNHIRNIRVYREDLESLVLAGEIFHPAFLDNLKHFKALRFMQAQGINNHPNNAVATLTSANRPRLTDAQWNNYNRGIPFEIGVLLGNRLNADPWMNIHFGATDDYVQDVAAASYNLMRNTRNSIYVEYGNEPWNSAFPYNISQNWLADNADARWASGGTHPYANYSPAGTPPNVVRLRGALNWYGMRSAQICRIWKQAWGADADRVKCTVNMFSGYDDLNNETLDCRMHVAEAGANNQPCYATFDVMASAPYFGHLGQDLATRQRFQNMAAAGLAGYTQYMNELDGLLNARGGNSTHDQMRRDAANAGRRGLELAAYEGGQHAVFYGLRPNTANPQFSDVAEVQFLHRANRHPLMYKVYEKYMNMWRDAGGHVFCHYDSISKNYWEGQWGLKEFETQEESPKYDAIRDFVYDNPCDWDGCSSD